MGERAIIIGAGQAGAQAAASLRQARFSGEITMFGAETEPPYQRPPLSKAYLQGELAAERLFLRPAAFYDQQKIDLRLGARIAKIDRAAKAVFTEKGEVPRLRLAPARDRRAAAAPRLSGRGSERRPLSPDDRRQRRFEARVRIGRAARRSSAPAISALKSRRARARQGSTLPFSKWPTGSSRASPAGNFFVLPRLHRDHGVDLRLRRRQLEGFEGDRRGPVRDSRYGAENPVQRRPGRRRRQTLDAPCGGSGLTLANGVWTRRHARTSDPAIYAAGDCANHPSRHLRSAHAS